jgi:hypothetical protein
MAISVTTTSDRPAARPMPALRQRGPPPVHERWRRQTGRGPVTAAVAVRVTAAVAVRVTAEVAVALVVGSSCLEKKAQISAVASSASDGSWARGRILAPPGQAWPPPTIVSRTTSEPSEQGA